MIVTDKQWDLLDVLVCIHESNGGTEFHFTCSGDDGEISYPGGIFLPGIHSATDLLKLRGKDLITLVPISQNVLRGKPTEYGIRIAPAMWHQRHFQITATPVVAGSPQEPAEAMSNSDIEFRENAPAPSIERSTKRYEEKCPHLVPTALELLKQRRAERDKQLSENIEFAQACLREEHEGTDLHEKITGLREKIVEVATNAAADGVKEFAIGLLISQKRVGAHAKWLREYAARLVAEIRATLTSAQVFQTAPLSPWSKDPIAQKAIYTCEKILSERWKMGDGRSCDLARELSESNLSWPPVVEEWEALKAAAEIESGPRERIPESALRAILSSLYRTKSDDLTQDQIYEAGAVLGLHYGSILMIPLELEAKERPKPAPESIETSQFWKEREDEFREHDVGRNAELSGRWASWGDKWSFHGLNAMGSPCTESLALFKSLAREAAKGLRSERGAEAWVDWLELLRCEKDEDTGTLLFAEVTPAAWTTSEREYAEMLQAGNKQFSRPLIEFVPTSGGRIERRPYWDTTNATIENLFRSSGNLCLQLRSLAPSLLQDRPPSTLKNLEDLIANHLKDPALNPEGENVASSLPATAVNKAARVDHWGVAALEERSVVESILPLVAGDEVIDQRAQCDIPKLDVGRIGKWMEDEGYDNKELATMLNISIRAVSSLRNDGKYHGTEALTKLANLMKCDVSDLYLP